MDVEDKDLGYQKIIRGFQALDGVAVTAGIHADAGRQDGVDLVDIAVFNEYGTRNIPARPFVRLAFDKNEAAWNKTIEAGCTAMANGTADVNRLTSVLGAQMVGDVQEVIGDRSLLAPNAPSTIKQKGSDAPLIDSGRLRQSVSYKVKKG